MIRSPSGNGFVFVPLLLGEAREAGTVAKGVVLERTLAALVADRAVQRVIGEQQLEHAGLRGDDLGRVGVDDHVRRDGRGAGSLQPRQLFDLHQAHAARADRLELGVVAEDRNLEPNQLRGLDQQRPLRGDNGFTVDGQVDRIGGLGHAFTMARRDTAVP